MSNRVQFPLTFFIPLKADQADAIREQFKTSDVVAEALGSTELVHFARFFVFEKDNIMGIPSNIAAVVTSYDGSFADYIQAFVDNKTAGEFFNQMLSVADVPGAEKVIPVQKNAQAFAALIAKYDVTNVMNEPWGSWFSAYPGATVQNIQDALK